MSDLELWEILLPTRDPRGARLDPGLRDRWSQHALDICGGVTLLGDQQGLWRSPEGATINEVVTPARVACTSVQLQRLIDVTHLLYDQEELMMYRISQQVVIVGRPLLAEVEG